MTKSNFKKSVWHHFSDIVVMSPKNVTRFFYFGLSHSQSKFLEMPVMDCDARR